MLQDILEIHSVTHIHIYIHIQVHAKLQECVHDDHLDAKLIVVLIQVLFLNHFCIKF